MTLAKRGPALDQLVHTARWGDPAHRAAGGAFGQDGAGAARPRTDRHTQRPPLRRLRYAGAVFDLFVAADMIRAACFEPATDLDTAVERADFVTIHCPKTPDTVGLFDARRLARMKRGAFIVNTARGGIIDEPALHQALRPHLAGAGLDVFAEEPTAADNPLLKLPNVISSPHMAGVTVELVAGMARVTAENILSVLDGTPIRGPTW